MPEPEPDTECTPLPVCPHCGHTHTDGWEYFTGGRESAMVDCEACGAPFRATQNVLITYTTRKPDDQ
jgi:hypothetical protein